MSDIAIYCAILNEYAAPYKVSLLKITETQYPKFPCFWQFKIRLIVTINDYGPEEYHFRSQFKFNCYLNLI